MSRSSSGPEPASKQPLGPGDFAPVEDGVVPRRTVGNETVPSVEAVGQRAESCSRHPTVVPRHPTVVSAQPTLSPRA
jgi:hypothetical protein